jgi:hypothetical protein
MDIASELLQILSHPGKAVTALLGLTSVLMDLLISLKATRLPILGQISPPRLVAMIPTHMAFHHNLLRLLVNQNLTLRFLRRVQASDSPYIPAPPPQ